MMLGPLWHHGLVEATKGNAAMRDADEFEIHTHKRTDRTYFRLRIPIADGRTLRIASKVLNGEALVYAKEKGELVLRRPPTGRKEIVADEKGNPTGE